MSIIQNVNKRIGNLEVELKRQKDYIDKHGSKNDSGEYDEQWEQYKNDYIQNGKMLVVMKKFRDDFKPTKLVVYNEHTLGYIQPETPNQVCILQHSQLKGSIRLSDAPFQIGSKDTVRLASEKDFNEYRVSFEGFGNDDYIYEQ